MAHSTNIQTQSSAPNLLTCALVIDKVAELLLYTDLDVRPFLRFQVTCKTIRRRCKVQLIYARAEHFVCVAFSDIRSPVCIGTFFVQFLLALAANQQASKDIDFLSTVSRWRPGCIQSHMHVAARFDWHRTAFALLDRWPIDVYAKSSSIPIVSHFDIVCLVLRRENVEILRAYVNKVGSQWFLRQSARLLLWVCRVMLPTHDRAALTLLTRFFPTWGSACKWIDSEVFEIDHIVDASEHVAFAQHFFDAIELDFDGWTRAATVDYIFSYISWQHDFGADALRFYLSYFSIAAHPERWDAVQVSLMRALWSAVDSENAAFVKVLLEADSVAHKSILGSERIALRNWARMYEPDATKIDVRHRKRESSALCSRLSHIF